MSEAQDSELKIGYFKIWISRLFFKIRNNNILFPDIDFLSQKSALDIFI